MGSLPSAALLCALGMMCLPSPVTGATIKEITEQVKLDATWIDTNARELVDLVFVLDRSGSVALNAADTLEFVKDFLDYFSIAPQHSQAGVILFSDTAIVGIPLRFDNHKCKFMKELENMTSITRGMTNAFAGLQLTQDMLMQIGRKSAGSLQVVVFVTDGDWNEGGDPTPIVDALKANGVLMIVITIGTNLLREQEMLKWASVDNRGRPMAFPMKDFAMFEHLAFYIHKGSHTSKFLPIDMASCQNKCRTASGAACLCDSLSTRGQPACGCDPGNFIQVIEAKEQCAKCPIGKYQERKNVYKTCKSCPTGQTTLAVKSALKSECVCDVGFWNPTDKSRTPYQGSCERVKCDRDSLAELDQHFMELNGTCQYTYGQPCNYQCVNGYRTSGVKVRSCQQNGKMHPPPATCSPVLCPDLPSTPNSNGWNCVNKDGNPPNKNYPFGIRCTNQCLPGYIPRQGTEQYLKCLLDKGRLTGNWSGRSLLCEPRTCTNLPDVLNGQYNLRECNHEGSHHVRTFGKRCRVSCNVGFVISKNVDYLCETDGRWTNYKETVSCRDIRAPQILNCPMHKMLNNEKGEGFAMVELKPLAAMDNDARSAIKQTMDIQLAGETTMTQYPCQRDCGQPKFIFPIGTSKIKFTVTDRSGNAASCEFKVTVQDIEKPTVLQCDGPATEDNGYIYSDVDPAFINWKEPEFTDNSHRPLSIYRSGSPGKYKLGRTWSIIYTAKDQSGNTAQCKVSFTLTGVRCPQLHVPANGALVCDKLSFGVYCSPQCERGLERLLPDHIRRTPHEYLCTVNGKWLPHQEVGDCAVGVPVTPDLLPLYEFKWYQGDCHEEATKQTIISNTINSLNHGFTVIGQGFKTSQPKPLTVDDFTVYCGPKNESIVQVQFGGGGRYKREAGASHSQNSISAELADMDLK